MARVGITFEDLLKASIVSLHVEQKETIKNIVLLVKNALKIFYCCKRRTSKLHANNFLGRNETTTIKKINSRIISSFTFLNHGRHNCEVWRSNMFSCGLQSVRNDTCHFLAIASHLKLLLPFQILLFAANQ